MNQIIFCHRCRCCSAKEGSNCGICSSLSIEILDPTDIDKELRQWRLWGEAGHIFEPQLRMLPLLVQ